MSQNRFTILRLVLVITLATSLFFAHVASADDGADFWDGVLNQNLIPNVDQLPYTTPKPDINWQTSGYITAWIDIVGFGNLSRDEDTYYIYGDPASLAIVQYNAKAKVPGSIQKITETVTTSISGDYTVSTLTVYVYWKSISCGKDSCWEVPHYETETFTDSELTPQQFIMPDVQEVELRQYSGGYQPQILSVSVKPPITEIRVDTVNASLTHILRYGVVNYTRKKVPFMEVYTFTMDKWQFTGANHSISSLMDDFVITNDNVTNVTFMTPYGTVNGNISKITMPTTEIHYGIFGIIFFVVCVLGGILYLRRCFK